MDKMKEALMHLDDHVAYPASKQDIVDACNKMADVPKRDKNWLMKRLPDQVYQSADEVKMALGLE